MNPGASSGRRPEPDLAGDEPLVSVVLPTYKRAHVLPFAIRGVLGQTWRNLELIVVSDNSPDDTAGVVASFNDPRLRFYVNERNLKLPGTLNRGFALACGDYLTWTSDDNLYAPTAIERMARRLQRGGCDFVFADYFEFAERDAGGEPTHSRHVCLPDAPDLKKGNSIGACFMYTRAVMERVGGYDTGLFLNEDYDYWMRVAREFRLGHIGEPLYWFARNEESLYCSRYCEVRAGSLLVRYKNRVINREELLAGVVEQVMANLDRHRSALVRGTYGALGRLSYRMKSGFERRMLGWLSCSLALGVGRLLDAYDRQAADFGATKAGLADLMSRTARIEYRGYVGAKR
jgi:glycosyltransferase involved in cell wall biosynthesis